MTYPIHRCVKVSNLRKHNYENMKEWMKDDKNYYAGRRGRIWITYDNCKEIFHYKGSEYANPYSLKEYTLRESLELYERHVKDNLMSNIRDLQKYNEIGCFCDESKECHVKVLIKLMKEMCKKET